MLLPAAVVVGAAGCVGRAAPEAAGPPPVYLDSADVGEVAELLRLEDRRELDRARMQALIQDDNPEVRGRAALAIGRIGDRAGVDLLLTSLADPAAGVRADAAFALGELGDTARAVVHELGVALARARTPPDPDMAVGVEVIAALGKLAAADAAASTLHAPLRRSLVEQPAAAWPTDLVQAALLAVWKGPRPETVDAVADWLRAEDPELRWRAAYALMRLGEAAGVTPLIAALGDSDHRVREQAARGLSAAAADSAGLRDEATAALVAAASDPHVHVRINAIRSIGSYALPALAPVVTPALSRGPNEAIVAAQTLARLGGPAAADALDRVAGADTLRIAVRGAAVASLAAVAPETAAPRIEALSRSEAWLERMYAAAALRGLPWRLAEPTARRLAADADPRVAAAALDAVGGLAGDTIPAAHALFVEGLGRPDPGVRAAATRGLAGRADPADLPLLLEAYETARADSDMNDAALAAIDALGELADRGVPVARSFYLRFPTSPDPLVRARALARIGLGRWETATPIETGRERGWYEQVVRELIAPELAGGARPRVRIHTATGAVDVDLAGAAAPLTVRNFLRLAAAGYFDGGRWHRVVPNFVAQDGDPRGDGSGGPGYAIRDEINRLRYERGAVGMALAGPDTGGSQFFITHSPQPHLDGGYTVFGRVAAGMDAVDSLVQDDPISRIEVLP